MGLWRPVKQVLPGPVYSGGTSENDNKLVFIWCNADQFMKRHQLRGFYSGMFISEVQEALMYGIATIFLDKTPALRLSK
jgi:hypothetical protein